MSLTSNNITTCPTYGRIKPLKVWYGVTNADLLFNDILISLYLSLFHALYLMRILVWDLLHYTLFGSIKSYMKVSR